ncbi:MAG: hypothetical protein IPH46_17675 [Bacteroidetes bacterium]|nr:hypothetical protein [Bacteroidota bacterium]
MEKNQPKQKNLVVKNLKPKKSNKKTVARKAIPKATKKIVVAMENVTIQIAVAQLYILHLHYLLC